MMMRKDMQTKMLTAYDMVLLYSGEMVINKIDSGFLEELVNRKEGLWFGDVLEGAALTVRSGSTVEMYLEKLGFRTVESEIISEIKEFCENYGQFVMNESVEG